MEYMLITRGMGIDKELAIDHYYLYLDRRTSRDATLRKYVHHLLMVAPII